MLIREWYPHIIRRPSPSWRKCFNLSKYATNGCKGT